MLRAAFWCQTDRGRHRPRLPIMCHANAVGRAHPRPPDDIPAADAKIRTFLRNSTSECRLTGSTSERSERLN
jgi:hypothetical protein